MKPSLKPRSEAAVQRAIVAALTLLLGNGARGFVLEQNAVRSRRVHRGVEPGTPDLQCVLSGGRVVFLEAKATTGLRPAQVKWHAKARKLGHAVGVVRSVADAVHLVQGMLAVRGA